MSRVIGTESSGNVLLPPSLHPKWPDMCTIFYLGILPCDGLFCMCARSHVYAHMAFSLAAFLS